MFNVIVGIQSFINRSHLVVFTGVYVNFGISIQRRIIEIFLLTFRQRVVKRDAKRATIAIANRKPKIKDSNF